MSELGLRIVSPTGTYGPFECDSVQVNVCDNLSGKCGGGYGIRQGHTKAILSLDNGKILAKKGGETVFCAVCGKGFATVENNLVLAVVDSCKPDMEKK